MTGPAPGLSSHHHVLVEGEASRPPLLLLHGSGGGERDLLPFASAVAGGFPIVAIRGAEAWEGGFAFFRRFADRTIDEANLVANAGVLAGFIEGVRAAYGSVGPPIAVGFSNGAIMAAALLLLRPGLLGGAVLLRPLSPFARWEEGGAGRVPVLAIDGARDDRRVAGDGLRAVRCLEGAGAAVEHHVLEGGHAIGAEDGGLVGRWLERFRWGGPNGGVGRGWMAG